MRLIDADKLLEPGYTDMFDAPIKFEMIGRYAILSAPTVPAIPLEYVTKNFHHSDFEQAFILILRMWEKENEKDI